MARKATNIRRRGSSWVVHFRREGRQVWRSFKTKDEAELFLANARIRQVKGQPEPTSRGIRLAAFADEWLEEYARVHVGAQTFVNYSNVLRVHILPTLGHLQLRELDRRTLDRFVSDWSSGGPLFEERVKAAREREIVRAREQNRPPRAIRVGRSPKTISNGIVVLCKMLGDAVEWGYLASNPAAKLKRPPDEREAGATMHTLDPEGVRALLAKAGDPFGRTLLMTAVMTGMRRGELLGVTWGDVDWQKRRIYVRRSIGLNGEAKRPKTAKSVRAIALPESLFSELRRHRLASSFSGEDDYIFPSSRGTALDGRNMVRIVFEPALRRAGLPKIRFHDLRHTFASLLIDQGAHPKYISEQLGHAGVQITMDCYGHLLDRSYADESGKLEAALFGTEPEKVAALA